MQLTNKPRVKRLTQYLFFVLIGLFMSFEAHSQDFYLGLKIGAGYSNFDYDGSSDYVIKDEILPNFGLVYNFRKGSSLLGFTIETGYSNRGARIKDDQTDYNLNYLDIPVMLDIYPVEKVKLNIGGEFGYLISAINKIDSDNKVNMTDKFDNRISNSLVFGANYSWSWFMDIGARYTMPLNKIRGVDVDLGIENLSINYFQVYMMLKIAN